MKRTMLFLSMIILFMIASGNHSLYGQISRIKEESQKNEERKKPRPRPKPTPIVDHCQDPPDHNHSPWEPINNWGGTR